MPLIDRSPSVVRAVLSAAALLVSMNAFAQTVIPNSARPDAIERQNRLKDTRPTVGGAPVITSEKPAKKSIAGSAQFVLKAVKIEGATAFGEAELKPLYDSKIGNKISLDDLGDIATDITTYYRNHGYILTRAVVPPQRAEGGVVTIRIVEGFVSDVKLQGDVKPGDRPLIRAYADKIREAKPLNSATLERYLLLMEDLPGVEARAVLQPSPDATGASEVVITIKRKRINASASFDNRGSRFLGPFQLSSTVAANNAFGLEEQTQLRAASSILQTEEFAYGELRHEAQLGTEGTKLSLSGSYVDTQPGQGLASLEIHGISYALAAGVSHPLIRSRQLNWFVNGDFTYRDVNVNSLGSSLYYDKTRVVTLGTTFDFVDAFSAVNRLEASVGNGLNLDTSSDTRSRANGKTGFTKINAKLSRLQPLYGAFSLQASASGQYSFQPLLAAEEFSIGGQEFGSAYDTAEITGDYGAAGRAELQYNQNPGYNYLQQYQLYGFYDIGVVYNRSVIAGVDQFRQSLSSVGGGLRSNINDSVAASVEGSLPLTRSVNALGDNGYDPRVFFSLQYRY